MARRFREPTIQEMRDAVNSIMEPGISDSQLCSRMENAARLLGISNLARRKRADDAHRNKVALASNKARDTGDLTDLRKLAQQNLARRRKG